MADDWPTAAFEEHRPHLRAVAYRLLGSMADADDAVQDSASGLRRPPGRYLDGDRARPGEGRVIADHRLRPAPGQLFVQAVGDGPQARQDAGPFGRVGEVA